jgi:hypothetical protein
LTYELTRGITNLSKLILFGEGSLKRALTEFVEHFHAERPHQGKGNVFLFPTEGLQQTVGAQITCKQRLGGCFDTTVVRHIFDPTATSDNRPILYERPCRGEPEKRYRR